MKNQSRYKCVIIDDEPIAIRVIQEHLGKFESFECLGSFTKAIDAIALLNYETIDLLFLDINMPGISGIEFLKSLAHPPKVIFTTAYRNFAVDAFELEALDYLVKPISFERFLKSMNKFLAINQTVRKEDKSVGEEKKYIILKSDKKNYKLKYEDILYIESLDNYIKVHTSDISIICYESLSAMENELPEQFIRIHRSYIVNINKIKVFSSSQIQIENKTLSIGRNYKNLVAAKLNQ